MCLWFTFVQEQRSHDPDAGPALLLVVPRYIVQETRQFTTALVVVHGATAAHRDDSGGRGRGVIVTHSTLKHLLNPSAAYNHLLCHDDSDTVYLQK
jgi:hypothetical protein